MKTKQRMTSAVLAATSIAFWVVLGVGAFLIFPDGGSAGSSAPDSDELAGPDPVVPADRDELPSEADCADGIDDDENGLIDCLDPSCQLRTCNDANLCTTGDTCQVESVCVGQPVQCSDDDLCTADVCDAATGECIAPPACEDGNDCTADSCDSSTGDCTFEALPDDLPCDDENACTINDVCHTGQCTGSTATEDCDNGIDDDCNELVDGDDPSCFA